MSDLATLLNDASDAILAGDFLAIQGIVNQIDALLPEVQLTPDQTIALGDRIERVQRLSLASASGIDVSRQWLSDLQKALGGLDVYGPEGRQRVETALPGKPRRF